MNFARLAEQLVLRAARRAQAAAEMRLHRRNADMQRWHRATLLWPHFAREDRGWKARYAAR